MEEELKKLSFNEQDLMKNKMDEGLEHIKKNSLDTNFDRKFFNGLVYEQSQSLQNIEKRN